MCVWAQPGSFDTTFNPGQGAWGAPYPGVFAVAVQPDGKALVGGRFGKLDQDTRYAIGRLNQDGSLDTTFHPLLNILDSVACITLQPDGKCIVTGQFTNSSTATSRWLMRLNPDGQIDTSFARGTGPDSVVLRCVLQPDGKILIGGGFTNVSGITTPILARLNADGSVDGSFQAPFDKGYVSAITLLTNGQILVGGFFTNVAGSGFDCLVRLSPNGDLDTSFNPGSGPNGPVFSILPLSDGKLIVGGFFSSYNNNLCYQLARLGVNGSFDAPLNLEQADILPLCLLGMPDGKVIVASLGSSTNTIMRLLSDGSQDFSFTGSTNVGSVYSVSMQGDGRLLIGGEFNSIDGYSSQNIARLNSDQSFTNSPARVDLTFNCSELPARTVIDGASIRSNRQVIITGNFADIAGTARSGIARLTPTGQNDFSFDPGLGIQPLGGGYVPLRTLVQSDGRILVFGYITRVDNTIRNGIARLNADGSLDAGFAPLTNFFYYSGAGVNSVAIEELTGNIVIGGTFNSFGATFNYVGRLHPNGLDDTTFNPALGFYSGEVSAMKSVAIQRDGKVVAGGRFGTAHGTPHPNIVRFNGDGSVDSSFRTVTFGSLSGVSEVDKLLIQPDGNIIILGSFDTVNGVVRPCIARLFPDGSVDRSFDPGQGLASGTVADALLQIDGGILVGGSFRYASGATRTGLARFLSDGSLDRDFNLRIAGGSPTSVNSINIFGDGKITFTGQFTSVNGVARSLIARLAGQKPRCRLSLVSSGADLVLPVPYYSLQTFIVESAPTIYGPWTAMRASTNAFPGGVMYLDKVNPDGVDQQLFRVRYFSP